MRGAFFVLWISGFFRHLEFVICHSHRSASIGWTLAARRAGSQQASTATAPSNSVIATKVTGSVGVIS
jgi:hypothetical protein